MCISRITTAWKRALPHGPCEFLRLCGTGSEHPTLDALCVIGDLLTAAKQQAFHEALTKQLRPETHLILSIASHEFSVKARLWRRSAWPVFSAKNRMSMPLCKGSILFPCLRAKISQKRLLRAKTRMDAGSIGYGRGRRPRNPSLPSSIPIFPTPFGSMAGTVMI